MVQLLLARGIMRALQARAAARFEAQAGNPGASQQAVLRRILWQNRDTEVGRRFGFSGIRDPGQYARQVPLTTGEEMASLVQRMAAGEPGVLTAQRPVYFCQTGGTTGEPKLSPVTRAYTREYQTTVHTWLCHVRRACPDIFHGKGLYFVGTAEAGRTPSGVPYGTMTGYNFRAMPGFVRRLYAMPYEISQIQDYEAKYYTVLRLALPQDVRFVVSVTPSTLLLLGRKMAEQGEALARDIQRGTLRDDLPLPDGVRRALGPWLAPDPACAARLQRAMRREGGTLRPVEAWPNLRRLACWKSGPSAPYIPQLRPFWGETPVRDAIYSATEGWMNIPMSDSEAGGALAVGTHFFEFYEEQDRRRSGPPLLARDLEPGRRYAIILTASSGMYRYDIKDIVQCVGHHHSTPVIAFSHKESGFSNLVGEKLSDHHAGEAARAAAEAAGLGLQLFFLCPGRSVPPRYEAHAEFSAAPTGQQARTFLHTLERVLGELAWEYASHRAAGDLLPPELVVQRPGTNDRLRQAFARRGGNEAQMKPRHLLGDPAQLPAELEAEQRYSLE